jgi:hypothetical protein
MMQSSRRGFLGAAAAAAGSLALPAKVFAQATPLDQRDRLLMQIAAREVQRAGNALWRKDIVGIADFGVPSSVPRFHFVNLEQNEVRSFFVAHGTGSDPEHDGWLKSFSNEYGSNATSRGAFISWEWYQGKFGTSMRLGGLDPENSMAFQRSIVVHSAWYAEPEMITRWGKLGRSNGCFAMAAGDLPHALLHLSGGRLIYADKLGLI